MSTVTVNPAVANGATIDASHVNDLASALSGDFVGRNTSGVATSGQKFGTAAIPWGEINATALNLNGSTIEALAVPATRIISGPYAQANLKVSAFLKADGSAATVNLRVTGVGIYETPLVLSVQAANLSVTANDTFTSLTLAPSTNNTCLVNDADLSGQFLTRLVGETPVTINNARKAAELTVDTMGTEISALVGTWQYFKIVSGGITEIFFAFVTSTTKLSNIRRGATSAGVSATDSTQASRIAISNNDTITLLKGNWLFLKRVSDTNYTKDTTTKAPWIKNSLEVGFVSPATNIPDKVPGTGDYAFDTTTNLWYEWNGSAWVSQAVVLIGVAICDSAACKYVKCEPYWKRHSGENSITRLDIFNTHTVRPNSGAVCWVNGTKVDFQNSQVVWSVEDTLLYDQTTTTSQLMFCYLAENGDVWVTDQPPRQPDEKLGYYHPLYPIRCVGMFMTDASDLIVQADVIEPPSGTRRGVSVNTSNGTGSTNTRIAKFTNVEYNDDPRIVYASSATLGDSFTIKKSGKYAITYTCSASAAAVRGVSKNSVNLTTSIETLAVAERLMVAYSGNATGADTMGGIFYLEAGDIIRAHWSGTGNGANAAYERFVVVALD